MSDTPSGWTREHLLAVIGHAIRSHQTYLSEDQACATADTVLRNLGAYGLRIRATRPAPDPAAMWRGLVLD